MGLQDEQSDILNVEQVAAKIGARPQLVRRWLREGRIYGVKLGGDRLGWRVHRVEMERFMNTLIRPDTAA